MSTTADLIVVLKKELKNSQMTYADLAKELDMAESSVKRMFAKTDMPLSRIDAICRVLKLDFAEVARRVANTEVLLQQLTDDQERAVVADKNLLLVAICSLSQWTMEEMITVYNLTEPQCIQCMVQLDRIGIIELRPMNRYRLMLAKTFRWKPHGPVMNFFRENVLGDYFSGGFDQHGESLMLVHGGISRAMAPSFTERIQKLAQDFAHQQQVDQKLPRDQKEGYTLLLGMRQWEFAAFTALRRDGA